MIITLHSYLSVFFCSVDFRCFVFFPLSNLLSGTLCNWFQAEQLLECLEICREFRAKLEEHSELVKAASKKENAPPPPQPPALMAAYQAVTPDDFLIEILQRIRSRYQSLF
jgi:hypothetical protein